MKKWCILSIFIALLLYFASTCTPQMYITDGSGNVYRGVTSLVIPNSSISQTGSYQLTMDMAIANITSGTITGITDLAVGDGGTGASTDAGARTNLGLGSMSTQNSDTVSISAGNIAGYVSPFRLSLYISANHSSVTQDSFTIPNAYSFRMLDPNVSTRTLSSTPTIQNGVSKGECIVLICGIPSRQVVISDNDYMAGSNIQLDSNTTFAITAHKSFSAIYDPNSGWVQL